MVVRLLIVDDFAIIHDLLKSFLVHIIEAKFSESIRCQVDTALQGKEAYEKVVSSKSINQPYQIIFMDMRMPPGWDGLLSTEKIFDVDPNTQVIFMSAFSDYPREQILQRLGKADQVKFADKPFNLKELENTVVTLVEKMVPKAGAENAKV